MTKFNSGQRVRFTRGPLGAIEVPGTTRFIGHVINPGHEGVVSEHKMPGDDDNWIYVEIERDGKTLYVPVDLDWVEVIA